MHAAIRAAVAAAAAVEPALGAAFAALSAAVAASRLQLSLVVHDVRRLLHGLPWKFRAVVHGRLPALPRRPLHAAIVAAAGAAAVGLSVAARAAAKREFNAESA